MRAAGATAAPRRRVPPANASRVAAAAAAAPTQPLSIDELDRRRVPWLVALAESYMHVADDAQSAPASSTSGAPSLAPDVASATLYASLALALDPDHVDARRIVALCHLLGGSELLFPFAPSSFGHVHAPHGYQPRTASRACALAVIHILQNGTRATFEDTGSARIYASACMALGRYREAQEALAHTAELPKRKQMSESKMPALPPRDVYTSQVYTQLARVAMKQAKYTEAAQYCTHARELDPLNWGAWTMLCDMAMAPAASDAWAPRAQAHAAGAKRRPEAAPSAAPPTDAGSAAPSAPRPVRRVTPRAAALRSGMAREAPPMPTRTLATSRTNVARPQDDARRRIVSKVRQASAGQAAPTAAPPPTNRPKSAAEAPPLTQLLDMTRDLAEAYRSVRRYEGSRAVEVLCPPPPSANAPLVPTIRRKAFRFAGVHCLVARALHDMTEYTDAEMHFRHARSMEPYLSMHMDIYSLVLFQLHREVALSALAQDLLAMDPRAPVAHIAAGNTWSVLHQHDAAYQCFRQATLVAPEYAYAYTLAGYEALELEQPARAVRLFRCARRCDRRHWNALAGLGQVYLRQGHELRASEAYAQAFLINRSNAVLLDLLGWTLEQSGDWDGALAVYQRAIAMQPKAAMTRLKKAQLLLRTVRAAEMDMDAAQNDADIVPLLSARERTQRRQAAHAELLRVCALAPSEPRVHLMLARSYMRLGGGHFAPGEDATPPTSPSHAARAPKLPHAFHAEITHHLTTAIDLDPRCVRDVNAMGDMPKLSFHAMGGAVIAEDEDDMADMAYDDVDVDADADADVDVEDDFDVEDMYDHSDMPEHSVDDDHDLDGYVWEG